MRKCLQLLGSCLQHFFKKGAQEEEKEVLTVLRKWWNSNHSAVNTNPVDLHLMTQEENAKDSAPTLLERVKRTYYNKT